MVVIAAVPQGMRVDVSVSSCALLFTLCVMHCYSVLFGSDYVVWECSRVRLTCELTRGVPC